jgi:glutamate formiminotransferase/formiminotetrahydrofolate cyclodeaminase
MGVLVDGLAQVSMNLTNYRRSPMAQVTEFVRREAQRYGVGIHHTEIVGLVPSRAIINAGRYFLQLDGFEHEQLLENRLFTQQDSQTGDSQVNFLDRVAEGTTAPGGGSAAAYAGALGAALAVMVARLTTGKAKYKDVEEECWQAIEKGEELRKKLTEAIELDAKSFEGILIARRLPRDTEENSKIRENAIMQASFTAAECAIELRSHVSAGDEVSLADGANWKLERHFRRSVWGFSGAGWIRSSFLKCRDQSAGL